MKKLIKFLSILLVAVLFTSSTLYTGSASASTLTPKKKIDKELRLKLDNLEKKYTDIKFIEPELLTEAPTEYLSFNSVEEFEIFMKDFKKNMKNEMIEKEVSLSSIRLASIEDTSTISWWAPFSGWPMNGLARWNNVVIDYNYDWSGGRPYFVSYSNVTSYIGGLDIVSWHQTGKAVNFSAKYSNKDTANIKVNGYYLLGVEISGAPIGFTQSDTWNCSLTITP
jgi:hypothetical protein